MNANISWEKVHQLQGVPCTESLNHLVTDVHVIQAFAIPSLAGIHDQSMEIKGEL